VTKRWRRHVTSARSDTIANRQVDVWETAYIWAFPVDGKAETEERERQLFHFLNQAVGLVAGQKRLPTVPLTELPEYQRAVLLPTEEIERRRELRFRLPRQVRQIGELLDVMVHIKDTASLRRSLAAHLKRLERLHAQFITVKAPEPEEPEERN
jgi:hypothetical protein